MAVIDSSSPEVRTLRGLHVFHAGRSNCAGRVRLLIEEKRLPWVSHYVDIYQRANVSEAYFAINPKGVVPTLVHDGRVVVESNDILQYLEEAFPVPALSPAAEADRDVMRAWLKRSAGIHIPGIKTFAYAHRHARNVVKTPEEVARYRQLQTDPELLAFHAKHDTPGSSFSAAEVGAATQLLSAAFDEMNALLSRSDWLVGQAYSLADVSWAPSITTLDRVGFPVRDYTNVMSWYARVSERPAFKRAITAWQGEVDTGVVSMPAGG